MKAQQHSIRKSLMAIDVSNREEFVERFTSLQLPEREKIEAPRRKVLSLIVDRGVKDIEILRADLGDALQLEARIQEERQQLTYLFHDLKEQEGVLELNRQLQFDYLKKKQKERLGQLANYRKLKSSEAQVEQLIGDFNARVELERSLEAERVASLGQADLGMIPLGPFALHKGRLPYPVLDGRVISQFGRAFDPRSRIIRF